MLTRKLLTAAVLATGIAAFASSAYASPMISGSIDVNGVSDSHTNTSISFLNPAGIDVVTGDFDELISVTSTPVSICYTCITMGSPFSAEGSGLPGSSLPFQLFTGTSNGNTVTFNVTSDIFTPISAGGLQITGMGIVSLTNFTNTVASFSLTVPSSGRASFDIKTEVPEPGTLVLFGAGLLGCALFLGRRRRSPNA